MTPLVVAFGAGLLATVNPCGCAMLLPAFLGFYVGDGDGEPVALAARVWQCLAVGAAVSIGFAGVFVAVGLLVSAGLRALLAAVPYAAAIIGLGLVGVGVAMARGAHIGLPAMDRLRQGQSRSRRRMVVFGAAYAGASLSCTLAVLLAVVAQALATASLLGILAVFAAYAAGVATILVALALSAALTREALARRIGRLLPLAGRTGGELLIASGVYLIVYWLPVVVGARPNSGLTGLSAGWSARATTFLEGHTRAFGYLAMTLIVGAGILAWTRWRGPGGPESISSVPSRASSSTLRAANAAIVNAHHRHRLLAAQEGGALSSSDGLRMPMRGRSLTGRALSRYFEHEGLTSYTHISDQYSTYGTRIIVHRTRRHLHAGRDPRQHHRAADRRAHHRQPRPDPGHLRPVRPDRLPPLSPDRQARRGSAVAMPSAQLLPTMAAGRPAAGPPRPDRRDRRALGRPSSHRGLAQARPCLGHCSSPSFRPAPASTPGQGHAGERQAAAHAPRPALVHRRGVPAPDRPPAQPGARPPTTSAGSSSSPTGERSAPPTTTTRPPGPVPTPSSSTPASCPPPATWRTPSTPSRPTGMRSAKRAKAHLSFAHVEAINPYGTLVFDIASVLNRSRRPLRRP